MVLWTLALLWMGLIFCLSAQPAEDSDALSGSVLEWVLRLLMPDYEKLSASARAVRLALFHTAFRKLAHFSTYAVLGVLWTLALRCDRWGRDCARWRVWVPFALCVLYACSDEIHQFFSDGRSCELRDVCIDALGSAVGIGLVYVLHAMLRLLRKWRGRHAVKQTK